MSIERLGVHNSEPLSDVDRELEAARERLERFEAERLSAGTVYCLGLPVIGLPAYARRPGIHRLEWIKVRGCVYSPGYIDVAEQDGRLVLCSVGLQPHCMVRIERGE